MDGIGEHADSTDKTMHSIRDIAHNYPMSFMYKVNRDEDRGTNIFQFTFKMDDKFEGMQLASEYPGIRRYSLKVREGSLK